MKKWIVILCLFGCASIPIPQAQQVQAAVAVGCAALDAAGCFDGVQDVFPGINAENCPARLSYLNDVAKNGKSDINTALLLLDKVDLRKFDPSKLQRLRNADCAKAKKALGVK